MPTDKLDSISTSLLSIENRVSNLEKHDTGSMTTDIKIILSNLEHIKNNCSALKTTLREDFVTKSDLKVLEVDNTHLHQELKEVKASVASLGNRLLAVVGVVIAAVITAVVKGLGVGS